MNGERFHVNAPPLRLQPGNDWSCLSRFPPRRPSLASVRLSRSLNDLLGINWTCCIWKGFRWSSRPAVTSNSPPDLPPARISHPPWRWILLDVTIGNNKSFYVPPKWNKAILVRTKKRHKWRWSASVSLHSDFGGRRAITAPGPSLISPPSQFRLCSKWWTLCNFGFTRLNPISFRYIFYHGDWKHSTCCFVRERVSG